MIVNANAITKVYRRGNEEIRALKGVDVSLAPSEFVCLLGHSGAGKTTMLNLFGLMDRPTGGSLEVAGNHINGHLSEDALDKIRRENIGFIFQQFYLMSTLTATENVEMPLIWSGASKPGRGRQLLDRVGLGHRMNHKPSELSGGEQQRVAIARALVNDPRLLLADEPTGNLDTKTRDSIFELFRELNEEGLAIILATHDAELAERVDRVIRIQEGRIVE
ncbi:MAG TPA: ABC transporter ATP-binding protein [Armatimonadota bacterium]|nr:ABC transporter ATP-binding protein [Armatimonadota bacterium]